MNLNGLISMAGLSLGIAGPALVAFAQQPTTDPSAPAREAQSNAASADDSGTMQRANADMRRVLQTLQQLGAKPIAQLTPEQARKQPSPADAVRAVMASDGKKAPNDVKAQDAHYQGPGGSQLIRIYTPAAASGQQGGQSHGLPVIVYYHGGGWVIADIKTYESSAQALARKANAIVMSAEYRHAPEHKFPAAHQDAFAAYQWALKNAKNYGGDPARIALAGESAGGNLAANVGIMARDKGVPLPVHMLLVYPVAGNNMNTPSYQENAKAMPLNKDAMQWFVKYALKPADQQSEMIDLVHANLKGLPPTTIITAEIDPLRSEGQQLAERLKAAGVDTTYQNFSGVTHEFFGMDAVVAGAVQAQDFAASDLRAAFNSGESTGQGSAVQEK